MNNSSMILVDSSVWIDFFKNSNSSIITLLIEEDLICTNELILSELLPFFNSIRHNDIIEGLLSLTRIEMDINWAGLRKMQIFNIQYGINKVGIPDLIILQQIMDHQVQLYTNGNHFSLMSQNFSFRLFDMDSI